MSASIQELYIGFFGRPADPFGATYWKSSSDNGSSAQDVLHAIGNASQGEFSTMYPSDSAEELIKTVYQNLFHRDPDAAGLAYWVGDWNKALSAGQDLKSLKADMVSWIINGIQGDDRTVLNNKVAVAEAYTQKLAAASSADIYTPTNSADVINYSRSILQSVGLEASSVNSAVQAMDGHVSHVLTIGHEVTAPTPIPTPTPTPTPTPAPASLLTIDGQALNMVGVELNGVKIVDNNTVEVVAAGAHSLKTDATATNFTKLLVSAVDQVDFNIDKLADLTHIDASNNSGGVSLASAFLTNLADVKLGSGNDMVYVAAIGNDLSVDMGAGNDQVQFNYAASSKSSIINLGDGNNEIILSDFGAPASSVDHKTSLVFGSGVNTVMFDGMGGNFKTIVESYSLDPVFADADAIAAANQKLSASIFSITGFGADDRLAGLAHGTVVTDSTTYASSPSTLAEVLTTVADNVKQVGASAEAFVYGSDTYVFVDAGISGVVDAGDAVVKLVGYTGAVNIS